MAYRVIKTIKGRQYIYEQSTYREGGKVRTRSSYIGAVDPVYSSSSRSAVNTTSLEKDEIILVLKSKDFQRFTKSPKAGRYPFALLPSPLVKYLGAKRAELFLSAPTQQKVLRKHPEVSSEAFEALSGACEQAEWYIDPRSSRHLVCFIEFAGKSWKVVVKGTARGEIYLQTYFQISKHSLRKQKKRYQKRLSELCSEA